jgi:hypothetical protein
METNSGPIALEETRILPGAPMYLERTDVARAVPLLVAAALPDLLRKLLRCHPSSSALAQDVC